MSRKPSPAGRILIAAHSHPAITKGGAEVAAWRHHQAMRDAGWTSSFLGCTRELTTRAGSVITQPFGANHYLYTSSSFDWFKFANPDPLFPAEFRALLADTRPDVVHFHHYAVLGLETLLHVRETLPDARIVLSLHEFQAICNHYGQMVKRPSRDLCRAASARDCNRCFPDTPRADFFLRDIYIRRFLGLADAFVAPSRFLATRYADWGLPAERLHVIENIPTPAAEPAPPPNGARLRVGFFGQISLLKGIAVLLDAAALLEADGNTAVQFDIHGDATNQPEEFRADFAERLKTAGRNARFHGAYDNDDVDRLMQQVDLVVVPSIWWENSPVVIQEALRNRRPVICSDIGGMAEKVRDGKDGFHLPPGNPAALADLIAGLAADRTRLAAVGKTLATPAEPAKVLDAYLGLYAGLRK